MLNDLLTPGVGIAEMIAGAMVDFIKDYQEQVWRLVFTGFDGSSTGNIEFNAELLSTTSTNNSLVKGSLDIFPNPSVNNQKITIIYDMQKANSISLHDIYGKEIEVYFIDYLRDLKVFESSKFLQAQLQKFYIVMELMISFHSSAISSP